MSRTAFEASLEKKRALKADESAGKVADSHSVRLEIMSRVKGGQITLAQAQAELKLIQKKAQSIGLMVREQSYKQG